MSEPPISPTTSWKELGHPEDSHQPQPQPQPKVDSSSDLEAQSIEDKDDSGQSTLASNNSHLPFFRDLNRKLSKLHVESTGIVPIPLQSRNDKKWWSVGLLWFSANTNVSTDRKRLIKGWWRDELVEKTGMSGGRKFNVVLSFSSRLSFD